MSAATKNKVNLKFRVILPADVIFLIKFLGIAFFNFTLALIVFTSFCIHHLHTTLGLVLTFVTALIGLISIKFILYVMSVSFKTGAALVMDRRGLIDQSSFIQWGFIAIEDLQSIGIRESLFGDMLKVRFRTVPKTDHLSLVQKWTQKVINIFDARAIYIPLGVLEVSRLNLESQFVHFGALMRHSAQQAADQGLSPRPGVSDDAFLNRIVEQSEPTKVSEISLPSLVPEIPSSMETEKETVLVDLDELTAHTVISEAQAPVINVNADVKEKVQSIKEFITSNEFDQKVCDLYTDFVVNFVNWQTHGDRRLPEAVVHPQVLSRSNDYEEIGFVWNGKQYQWALRRDVGPANKALLSIAYSGKNIMTMSVRVQIGSFDPGALEAFHYGEWCQALLALHKSCEEAQFAGSRDGEDEETSIQELDLESLGENFSIEPPKKD